MAFVHEDGRRIADFRSDTVTRPTPAMREAMAKAVVGDDVFEDDPTVADLERRAAALFGKEAGLFVPTGTMGNLIAMACHSSPGDEVFVDSLSHAYNNEVGGAARFAGVLTRTFDAPRGRIDPDAVRRFARPGNLHNPRTALLVVENTHNFWGGAVVPLAHLDALFAVTREKGIALHIDGARIFNAIVATGTTPADWGARCDSIQLCLSKGLGAPIGSLVLGTKMFIEKARRTRKVLGGGMRQVGVIAAPARLALEDGPKHLAADHARARRLAEAAAKLPGAVVDPSACETNILFFRTTAGVASYGPLVAELERRGILCAALGELGVRFVTHRDVDDQDVDALLAALRDVLPSLTGARQRAHA
jgi:threonine aldolase